MRMKQIAVPLQHKKDSTTILKHFNNNSPTVIEWGDNKI
jgi:hypothetical protein